MQSFTSVIDTQHLLYMRYVFYQIHDILACVNQNEILMKRRIQDYATKHVFPLLSFRSSISLFFIFFQIVTITLKSFYQDNNKRVQHHIYH